MRVLRLPHLDKVAVSGLQEATHVIDGAATTAEGFDRILMQCLLEAEFGEIDGYEVVAGVRLIHAQGGHLFNREHLSLWLAEIKGDEHHQIIETTLTPAVTQFEKGGRDDLRAWVRDLLKLGAGETANKSGTKQDLFAKLRRSVGGLL